MNELHKKWYERLAHAIFGEPDDREALLEFLHGAEQRHVLSQDTLNMMEGALAVSEMSVKDIMIPRTQMTTIPKDATFNEILPIVLDSAHSRYPILGDKNRDEIIGILLVKDLLNYHLPEQQEKFNLREILRPAVFVPESKRLNALLREFRHKRNHIAVVLDEYGTVSGLVTIEDVIEQIVGDIEDEYDVAEDPFIKKHDENEYTVKAITPLEEFNQFFRTNFEHDEVETIGGYLLRHLGHLPKRNDVIAVDNMEIKITQADSRRILTIRVKHLSAEDAHRNTP